MKQVEKQQVLERLKPRLVQIHAKRPGKATKYCHEWKAGKLPLGWKYCSWCKIIRHTESGNHTYYTLGKVAA